MITYLNALVCIAICLRLIFFDSTKLTYRPYFNVLAYALAVVCGVTALKNMMGLSIADIEQLIRNLALCLAVYAHKGNVASLRNGFHPKQPGRHYD